MSSPNERRPLLSTTKSDESTDRLAELFLEHPAWVDAARHLSADATSAVYFSHRPGERWSLVRSRGRTRLMAEPAHDPDLVFRFSPDSIVRLAALEGGVGEFAVTLFEEIVDGHVDLRIAAGFLRLTRRGYVKLLVSAGPPVLAFGATHGIRTLGALRRFVVDLGSKGPADWEA